MYNDAISKHDVKPNDKWMLNSRSTFYCGDFLEMSRNIAQVDFVYTDPPWNQAILNQFYKSAQAGTPDPLNIFLDKRLSLLKDICPYGTIYIEFGLKNAELAVRSFEDCGAKLLKHEKQTYGSAKTEMLLMAFTFSNKITDVVLPVLAHSWDICKQTLLLNNHKNQTMLDCFCGEGYFIREALKLNCLTFGTEIIPEKFASLIQKTKGDWTCLRM